MDKIGAEKLVKVAPFCYCPKYVINKNAEKQFTFRHFY